MNSRFTLYLAAALVVLALQFAIPPADAQIADKGEMDLHFAVEDSSDDLFTRDQIQILLALKDKKFIVFIQVYYSSERYKTRNGKAITLAQSDYYNRLLALGRGRCVVHYVPDAIILDPKVGGRMVKVTWGLNPNAPELSRDPAPEDVQAIYKRGNANRKASQVKVKDWRFEPGLTFLPTDHTNHILIPFLGLGLRYKHFELVARGSVLPSIRKATKQRFVFGELAVGATIGKNHDLGIAVKLGGYQIKTHNWQSNDIQCGFGGFEGKVRMSFLSDKLFAKPSLIWKTERFYRPEGQRYRWDRDLSVTYQATLSAEL